MGSESLVLVYGPWTKAMGYVQTLGPRGLSKSRAQGPWQHTDVENLEVASTAVYKGHV